VTNQKPELNTRNNTGLSVAIFLVISLPQVLECLFKPALILDSSEQTDILLTLHWVALPYGFLLAELLSQGIDPLPSS
jgi:hypothetical protein